MDIKQLKYFYAIAQEGQITSAAKKLHIAQPPLSYQLKSLENELGVKLMKRGSRRIKLTDAGNILLNRAEQILGLTETAVKEIKDFKEGLHGTLTLGAVSSSGSSILMKKFNIFHKKYPDVNFKILEGNTFKILEMLNKGIIEIGIVRSPFNLHNLNAIYLEAEPMAAAMIENFNWNKENTIDIKDLKGKPLTTYRRFEKLIMENCEKCDFEPDFFCINDDSRTTIAWAKAGLGIAIVPYSVTTFMGSSGLVVKKIENSALKTQIAAAWIKDRFISSSAKNFLELFKNEDML